MKKKKKKESKKVGNRESGSDLGVARPKRA